MATVGIILLLLLLLCGALTIPAVQTNLTQKVTDVVKDKFGVDISVGYVGINFKGNVVLEDLYLPDCNNDTLAYIQRLEAGCNPATVWHGSKLTLSKVSLDSFKIYVSSKADVYNFEYLIDAFSSSDTTDVDTTPSNFDLELSDIALRRGVLKYDIIDSSYVVETGHAPSSNKINAFDYNHIHLSDVSILGYLKSIKTDNLRAEISQLTAYEELSHVRINELKILDFAMLADGFSSKQIALQTPKSNLTINDIAWNYPAILDNIDEAIHRGEYNVDIAPSTIVLSEIAPFVPALAKHHSPISLYMSAKGTLPMVNVEVLQVDCEDASVHAVASMSDCYNYKNSNYNADLLVSADNGDFLAMVDTSLQNNEILKRLFPFVTNLKAKGNACDVAFDLGANSPVVKLKSEGKLVFDKKTDVMNLVATLATDTADIAKLIGDTTRLMAKLDVNANLTMTESDGLLVRATGAVPYLAYDKIVATSLTIDSASYSSESAAANISFNEPFGSAAFSASYIPAEKNIYVLNGGVKDFSPYKLGVMDSTWNDFSVSLNIDSRMIMSSLNDIVGHTDIDSLIFIKGKKNLDVGKISLAADDRDSRRQVQLRSRILDISFGGRYNIEALEASVVNILHPYLPTFFNHKIQEGIDTTVANNQFKMQADVKDIAPVCDFFDVPLSVTGMKLTFLISDSLNRLGAVVKVDSVVYNDIVAKDIDITFRPSEKMYVGGVQTIVYANEMKPIKFNLSTELENDVALTTFKYDNFDEEQKITGDIKALLTFPKDSITKEVLFKTFFMPSDLLLRDLLIGFEPSVITARQDGNTKIEHFGLTEDDRQILLVDGTVGNSVDDSLKVSFDSMSISSVISKLRMGIPLSGFITGDVMARGVTGDMPRFGTTNLRVDSLVVDSIWVGDLEVKCGWNPERKAVGTKITISRDTTEIATAGGIVSPGNDMLRLRFNVKEFPLATAQIMIDDYLDKLTGTVSANIDVVGKISEPEVKGYIYLDKVLAKIKANNASYRVTDSILFTPTSMTIKDAKIVDDYGRVANLECNIQHHNFRNPKYIATLTLNDFLLLNNPKSKDEMVYGKLTVDGRMRVAGDADGASIRGNVTTGESAVMTVVLPESASSANEYSTIVFVSHEDTVETKKYDETKFNIDASVELKVTDNTEMTVVLSRTTGDKCSLKGGGNMRVEYTTTSDEIKLYGDYIIEEGQLKMKISNLPQKTFAIEKGGTVNVGGKLESLKFDLSALYTTRADLATLDESFANEQNTRQTVGARLDIDGSMDKVNLSYDVVLPNAGDDLNQRLQGIINTDDLKIKEFVYILGFGTFCPVSSSTGSNVGSSMLSSIVSSSISNGMNTLFGDVLGSSWTIGADMSSGQADGSDMEMSLSLSRSFFNDRLVFSTDFGYQNNTGTGEGEDSKNFDLKNFELEYKLNKSGSLRLKGYHHTNTEFYRSGTGTEGLGFVITKEAYTFKDLMRIRKQK